MSKIYIYDCDWKHDSKFYNALSMKLSRKKKKKGDEVHLLDET